MNHGDGVSGGMKGMPEAVIGSLFDKSLSCFKVNSLIDVKKGPHFGFSAKSDDLTSDEDKKLLGTYKTMGYLVKKEDDFDD